MASVQTSPASPQKGFDKKENAEASLVKKPASPDKKMTTSPSKKKDNPAQDKSVKEGSKIVENHQTNSPVKSSQDKTKDKTVDKAVDKTVDKTADEAVDKTVNKTVDNTVDTTVDKTTTGKSNSLDRSNPHEKSPEKNAKKLSESEDKKLTQESPIKNKSAENSDDKRKHDKKSPEKSTSEGETVSSEVVDLNSRVKVACEKTVSSSNNGGSISDEKTSNVESNEKDPEKLIEGQTETHISIQNICKKIENNSLDKSKALSKNAVRLEVWNKFVKSSLLLFNRSCNYRVPHFKGSILAAHNLTTLDVYKSAKVVKVNLDKAHECIRLQLIEDRKDLIVGCPGLREAVFLHVQPPVEPSKYSNKLASTRVGICHVGSALDFSSGVQADLVIAGSVAVDKTGRRIGKGEGFSDLEYALLKKLGGIAPTAPVITVVHDSQVYESLPEELFKTHDVYADYIVTPTQVIEVKPQRKQPELMWNLLSHRRINNIPIIKQLLDKEQNIEGKNITVKEEDTDTEELEDIARRKRYFMRKRFYSTPRRPNSNQQQDYVKGRRRRYNTNSPNGQQPQRQQRSSSAPPTARFHKPFYRRRQPRQEVSQQQQLQQQQMQQRKVGNNNRRLNRVGRQMIHKPRYKIDFSLKVLGLTSGMRVRDLKAALMERGVRPRDISWMSNKGLAYLHFTKPKENQKPPEVPYDLDNILISLQDMTIKCENGSETKVRVDATVPIRKVQFHDQMENVKTQI